MMSAAAAMLDLADNEVSIACVTATRSVLGCSAVLVCCLLCLSLPLHSSRHRLRSDTTTRWRVDVLPATTLLHEWLHAVLTHSPVGPLDTYRDADTFTHHYHSHPRQASELQSRLTNAVTNKLDNVRVREERSAHGAWQPAWAGSSMRWQDEVHLAMEARQADGACVHAVRRSLPLRCSPGPGTADES